MFRYRNRGPTLACILIDIQASDCSFSERVRRELGREVVLGIVLSCSVVVTSWYPSVLHTYQGAVLLTCMGRPWLLTASQRQAFASLGIWRQEA